MSVAHQLSDNHKFLTIAVNGDLDMATNVEIMCLLEHRGVTEYRIDLADVENIDSTALGMLLVFREKARESHADMRLTNVGPEVRHFLSLTRFNKLFNMD